MDKKDIQIRTASVNDARALFDIYEPYVRKTAITFEYDVPSLEEFLSRIQLTLLKYPFILAEADGEILGFAYASAFKQRAAYDWAVETSIYVKTDKKRMSIGSKLYQALELILKEQNILNLNACIAYPEKEDEYLTKDSAIFHEKLGFKRVAMFSKCGYKFNRWYNMIWMEKHIGEHIQYQPAVKTFDEVRETIKKKYGIY